MNLFFILLIFIASNLKEENNNPAVATIGSANSNKPKLPPINSAQIKNKGKILPFDDSDDKIKKKFEAIEIQESQGPSLDGISLPPMKK